jgi:hypothetical protein
VKHRWIGIVGAVVLVGTVFPTLLISQSAQTTQPTGPYARIAFMRAIDERHSVDLDAAYVRHLEWHRQVKDTSNWYAYSVWASTERQRWIIYATFGHTATELSNPVSPAEDERDTIINLLPHVEFRGARFMSSCRHFRAGMACRPRLFGPSTPRSSSTTVRARPSRRPSPPNSQSCRVRRSGIDWSQVEMRRATCAYVHAQTWRPFWMSALIRRFLTK